LAALLGFLAFAIAWLPHLAIFGVVLGGLALLLGLIGGLFHLRRPQERERLSLVGLSVGLLACVFASAVHLGYARLFVPAALPPTEPGGRGPSGAPRVVVVDPAELLQQIKSKDVEARNKAVASLAEITAGLGDFVPALTECMLNDDDAH